MNKKEFQKVISKIRNDRKKETGNKNCEYPKAMMTGQQIKKNTATVNCGGEWYGEESKELANAVMQDERFKQLIGKYNAKASTEVNPFGGVQIRINY